MARAAPAREVCWGSAVCLEAAAGAGSRVETPQPTLHGRLTEEPEAV
jgi:hypothetical protein